MVRHCLRIELCQNSEYTVSHLVILASVIVIVLLSLEIQ